MHKLVAVVAAIGVLTGCAHDPYYGRRSYTGDAVLGGVLGAATGAVVGNAIGGRTSTVVGGALGAALGTAIATDSYRRQYDQEYGHRHYRYDDDYRPRPYGNYGYGPYAGANGWTH